MEVHRLPKPHALSRVRTLIVNDPECVLDFDEPTLDYLEAFNQMEAELRQAEPTIPDFSDPVAAARAWADEIERNRASLAIA